MLKRFLLTIVIVLFPLGSVLAKGPITNPLAGFAPEPIKQEETKAEQTSEETPSDEINELEKEIEEFTPFIDTGNIGLPIAPEVMRSMAEQDVPQNILDDNNSSPKLVKIETEEEEEIANGMDQLLAKENEEEDEDDNEAASDNSQIIAKAPENKENEAKANPQIPVEVKDAKPDAPMPNEMLANTPLTPEKATLPAQTKLVKEEADEGNNAKETTATEISPTPAPEPETPPVPAFAEANNRAAAPTQIAKPERPKIAIRKPKPKQKKDAKLKRFIRDESIFILFKDDDIILGNLSQRAKLDQMPFPKYLSLYKESLEEETGMERAVQMEKFIKARSYIAHVPIKKKLLKKSVRKEIRASNLSDLRALDNHYEIIDMVLDSNGNTALHIATYEDNPAIVKWLIMRGAHLNALNIDSITATEIAGSKRNWKIFEMLETASDS